jgi:hypothetical protein
MPDRRIKKRDQTDGEEKQSEKSVIHLFRVERSRDLSHR